MPAKPPRAVINLSDRPALIALRSAPAQKTGFSWPSLFAVSTPTQTFGSASSLSMAASTPLATSGLMALRAWGRFRVMIATCPRVS